MTNIESSEAIMLFYLCSAGNSVHSIVYLAACLGSKQLHTFQFFNCLQEKLKLDDKVNDDISQESNS